MEEDGIMATFQMTNIDPGEGQPLVDDNYLAVYGGTSLLDLFYPIGTYYETSNTSFDPNISWGGVWVEDSTGRVTVSRDSGTFNTVGATGGEESHTLTTAEMPAHNHAWDGVNDGASTSSQSGNYPFRIYQDRKVNWTGTRSVMKNTGGGSAHNNLQPYVVVKRWHRIN